ncbi:hypothetical protein D9M71_743740 [compost metagenome]
MEYIYARFVFINEFLIDLQPSRYSRPCLASSQLKSRSRHFPWAITTKWLTLLTSQQLGQLFAMIFEQVSYL